MMKMAIYHRLILCFQLNYQIELVAYGTNADVEG